jgi:hypothetical protein
MVADDRAGGSPRPDPEVKQMDELAGFVLWTGLLLLLVGGLLGRYFYPKRIFEVERPLFVPPPTAAAIPPTVKHWLCFRVPRSMHISESAEATVEYFQGLTYFPFEAVNSFLYEKLDLLPRSLPYSLRGMIWSFSSRGTKPYLEEDFSARASSSKMSVAPEGWIVREKGARTPCRWRWAVSGGDLGRYDLVVDLNKAFKRAFPKEFDGDPQVIFQIEVRSLAGLSLKTVKAIKYATIALGSALSGIGTLIAASQPVKDFVAHLIKPWLRL